MAPALSKLIFSLFVNLSPNRLVIQYIFHMVQLLKQKSQPKIIITDHILMILAASIAVIQWATTTVRSVIWSSL